MNTTLERVYEMDERGKMRLIDQSAGQGLEVGQVLRWGGNYGWPETDYVVLNETERGYQCFDRDHQEKNAMLHHVEHHGIRREDDPSLWHSQHFFITDEVVASWQVAAYREMHQAQADVKAKAEAEAKGERERLEAEGRALWGRLIGPEAAYVIVAEQMHDDSDMQSDYFASHASKTVILAASKHGRDNFAEMRKAALAIPETAHLGPGKDVWTPRVVLAVDVNDRGSCYNEGQYSHWHRELDQNEQGLPVRCDTEAGALAYIASKGEPEPILFETQLVTFAWRIEKASIEHREKYSGGQGYYLQRGGCHSDGWRVSKTSAKGYGRAEVDTGLLVALAKRHEHIGR